MNGITNHEIIKFFSKEENEDIQKNFVAVFPSNFVNPFISFSRYSSKKKVFLFDSFHFNRLKEFIIQDDRKIINVLMYSLRKFDKIGNINNTVFKNFFDE